MEIKSETLINAKGVEKSRVWTLSEGLGVLRSLAIGGTIFLILTVPLMLNIQASKFRSESSSLMIKAKTFQDQILSKKGMIDSALEKYFPNAILIKIDGKKFFLRSK